MNDFDWGEEYCPPHPRQALPEQKMWEHHVQLRIQDYNGTSKDALEPCDECHDTIHGGLRCIVVAGVKDIRKNCIFAHTNKQCAHDYFEYEFEGTCEILGIEYTYARKELGWSDEEGWPEKISEKCWIEGRGRVKTPSDTGLSGSAGDADGAS